MGKICKNCCKPVEENFDFCPYCSEAISEVAKKINQQKTINCQLKLISSLMDEVDDLKTLNVLKELAKKLASK